MPKVNISRTELDGPQVEPGTYPARIDKITKRVSQNQNEVMNIHWTITGSEPPAGVRILDNITLVPDAYWKLNMLLKAVRYTPGEDGFMTEDLFGRECQIVCTEEEYQGNRRMKVNSYLPL